jgi:hypothetical protein
LSRKQVADDGHSAASSGEASSAGGALARSASAKPKRRNSGAAVVVSRYTLLSPFTQAVASRSPISAIPVPRPRSPGATATERNRPVRSYASSAATPTTSAPRRATTYASGNPSRTTSVGSALARISASIAASSASVGAPSVTPSGRFVLANAHRRNRSSSRTAPNRAATLAADASGSALAGSGSGQCMRASAPGHAGQTSSAHSVITASMLAGSIASTDLLCWPVMSIATSLIASIAPGLTRLGALPALWTRTRPPNSVRARPSAICDRAELATHRNSRLEYMLLIVIRPGRRGTVNSSRGPGPRATGAPLATPPRPGA